MFGNPKGMSFFETWTMEAAMNDCRWIKFSKDYVNEGARIDLNTLLRY